MNSDYEKSSDEIEREVESSRANVQNTLRELSDRMSPGQLVDQAVDYLKTSGGNEFAHNLGRQVRDNPLPLVLVGAGLGWLMLGGQPAARRMIGSGEPHHYPPPSGRLGAPVEAYGSGIAPRPAGPMPTSSTAGSGSSMGSRLSSATHAVGNAGSSAAHSVSSAGSSAAHSISSTASSAGHAIGSAGSSAAQAASDAASRVSSGVSSAYDRSAGAVSSAYEHATDAASSTYEEARRRAQHAGEAISGAASDMAHRASYMSESFRHSAGRATGYAQDRWGRMIEEQPLVLGGIGLAIGALLGASLPRTRIENEFVGETADHFKDAVIDTATEQYEQAAQVASDTYQGVVDSIQESGVTQKVAEAVTAAADKARDTVKSASEQAREKLDEKTDQAKQKMNEAGQSGSTTSSTGSSPSSSSSSSSSTSTPGSASRTQWTGPAAGSTSSTGTGTSAGTGTGTGTTPSQSSKPALGDLDRN